MKCFRKNITYYLLLIGFQCSIKRAIKIKHSDSKHGLNFFAPNLEMIKKKDKKDEIWSFHFTSCFVCVFRLMAATKNATAGCLDLVVYKWPIYAWYPF